MRLVAGKDRYPGDFLTVHDGAFAAEVGQCPVDRPECLGKVLLLPREKRRALCALAA